MAQITVQMTVTKLLSRVYEIRAIAGGKFYKRQYIGYTEKKAIKLFQEWLGEQL